MKYFTTLLSVLLLCTSVYAQSLSADSTLQTNAINQASHMANLLLKKDYKAFTAYTYAPIIKMSGGIDKMTSYMEESLKTMESDGFIFDKITIGNCSKIVYTERQLQCTLTEVIEMKYKEGRIIQKATLIGLSNDKGLTWTFIDTHGATLMELQETVKELSNSLVIPEQEEPEVILN